MSTANYSDFALVLGMTVFGQVEQKSRTAEASQSRFG